MKKILVVAALFAANGLIPAHADEIEIAKEVIGLYQSDARQRFDREISFNIQEAYDPNAFANPNDFSITITTGALYASKDDEVLSTICHELGHFFGLRHEINGTTQRLAVEGEADYFSGSCMVRYLTVKRGMSKSQAMQEAVNIAMSEGPVYYRERVNPNQAQGKVGNGINARYPEPDCRILTVIHGVQGLKRPACWYNPSL